MQAANRGVCSARPSPPMVEVLGRLRLADVEFLEEGEAATRPARFAYGPTSIELDWWLDDFREKSVNLKCWAGQVTTANLFSELLPLIDEHSEGHDVFGREHDKGQVWCRPSFCLERVGFRFFTE